MLPHENTRFFAIQVPSNGNIGQPFGVENRLGRSSAHERGCVAELPFCNCTLSSAAWLLQLVLNRCFQANPYLYLEVGIYTSLLYISGTRILQFQSRSTSAKSGDAVNGMMGGIIT
jgi:hypothetical protein